jgi:ketosteroid isomerase-like protein
MMPMVTCAHDAARRALPLVNDAAALEEANARFYRAFEALDIAEMDAVWAHGEHVRCVHPGWPMLCGWEGVRESWRRIFENTEEMRFSLSDVHVNVADELGWVTCTENILSEVGDRLSVTAILATNLFERAPDGWRMVHHHASHVLGPAGG